MGECMGFVCRLSVWSAVVYFCVFIRITLFVTAEESMHALDGTVVV